MKYVAAAIVMSTTAMGAEALHSVPWGTLPAWGVVAAGAGVMLKFLTGSVDRKLDKVIELLEELVDTMK